MKSFVCVTFVPFFRIHVKSRFFIKNMETQTKIVNAGSTASYTLITGILTVLIKYVLYK